MRRVIISLLVVITVVRGWDSLNKYINEIADNLKTITDQAITLESNIIDTIWQKYRHLHEYKVDDHDSLKSSFTNNLLRVLKHNVEYKLGKHTFELGLNKYSHFSPDEMNKMLNGFRKINKPSAKSQSNFNKHQLTCDNCSLEIDWRKKNLVTNVKDQGQCGSCYAFSATGALEAMYSKAHGSLIELSEQQLVDCSVGWGNQGCNGGLMDNCFEYVREIEGIQSEKSYPYEAQQDECRFNSKLNITSCDYFIDLPEDDEHALMDAVYKIGPISVAIDAGSYSFMSYRKGIYYDDMCSPQGLNHGVLVVGYGVEVIDNKRHPYWLVKNSWSESWGDKGYIKMARFYNNMCGIASYASYPVLLESKSK